MKESSRRQFLKVGGSLAIGVSIAGMVGRYAWKMFTHPEQLFHEEGGGEFGIGEKEETFRSPYRKTFAFLAPDNISAFDIYSDRIFLATPNNVYIYGMGGQLEANFSTPSDVRDIAVYEDDVYLLYASRIEVYSQEGAELKGWQACNDDADYCSFTVFDGGIFVTDASSKHICKYNLDGTLARFIQSPEGFVVPSYCFGIMNMDGTVYCSNPGRHKVEAYTKDGDFIGSFGKAGTQDGAFSGCCNPVYLAPTTAGEILTSEKGRPRVSCYGKDGRFRSVLLSGEMLGHGHTAFDVRVYRDRLIVVGGKKVQAFQYDEKAAKGTLCGRCTKDCPMKV